MVLRLVVRVGGREVRFRLQAGETLVGSEVGCGLRLADPTVSRRHARLHVADGRVVVEDLGSSNGTLIAGHRLVGPVELEPGTPISFGTVVASLEEVAADDLETAVALAAPAALASAPAPGVTESLGSVTAFALDGLPAIAECLARGGDPLAVARVAATALLEHLPFSEVEVDRVATGGVLFAARRGPSCGRAVTVRAGDLELRVVVAGDRVAAAHHRLVELAASLIRAADEAAVSVPPTVCGSPPPPPEPPSLEPDVRRLYADAARVARGEVCVLVTGESGTGKEVLARFIHGASARRDGPFVALNCAALPRDLLEAELFGIERGVATGVESRPGRFELAHRGTLFLDEIGDMPAEVQAAILRALQEGQVYRLGGREPRPAAVRVVSATNRDVDALLASGAFRLDLYHRIADWRAHLPALRERPADVVNLAAFFLAREGVRVGLRPGGLSRAAVAALAAHDWPGNVRQLEREMARAVLFLEDGELLETRHLSIAGGSPTVPTTLADVLAAVERREIRRALAAADGDTAAAAARLGIARSSLYRRIKDLGLELPSGGGS